MGKVSESAVRSALQKPGWVQCKCQRTPCEQVYYVLPSKVGAVKFCSVGCNDEPPEIRFWKSVTKDGPEHPADPSLGCCWNSKFTPSAQYPSFKVNGSQIRAARFSLELFLGRPIATGMYALHSCDNPRCVNPSHLREGNDQDNSNDRVGRERGANGEAHGNSKLTNEQVVEIKKLKGLRTLAETAEQFNKSVSCIWAIWNDKTWSHIKDTIDGTESRV